MASRRIAGRIFISYRRGDTSATAGRLYDRLEARFGADKVFMDVDTVPPGLDFIEAIEAAVGSCDVVLVVIGAIWLDATDEDGHRRLDSPDDFVVLEIRAGLERKIPVIPVLVNGALQLQRDKLPASLATLARRQSIRLDHESFNADSRRLINVLERMFAASPLHGDDKAPYLQGANNIDRIADVSAASPGDLNRSLELQPDNTDTLRGRGECYLVLSRFDDAVRDFDRVLQLNPDNAAALRVRGEANRGRGRYDDAVRDFDRSLQLEPDNAYAFRGRGEANRRRGRHDDAMRDFNRSLELQPDNADTLQGHRTGQ